MPAQLVRQPCFPSELHFNIPVIPRPQVQPWRCWHHHHSPAHGTEHQPACSHALPAFPMLPDILPLWEKISDLAEHGLPKKECADPWMGIRLSYSRDSRVCSGQERYNYFFDGLRTFPVLRAQNVFRQLLMVTCIFVLSSTKALKKPKTNTTKKTK